MALNLIQLQDGMKAFGARRIFSGASCSVNEGEHVGVIGPNGAGKTTFFRILTGEEELESGALVRSRELRLGYLSQHDQWAPGQTANAYLEAVSRIPLWELKNLGRLLQLSEPLLARPMSALSGGYRMRVKLLGLLGQEPNLMLLDEPTNYLDLETTLLLESFLQGFRGAFLLISHDREFLRRTTDHILEIEAGEMTKFNGNIDDYFEQKELLRSQLAASAAAQDKRRREILDFVARFGAKATKARQAQSRLKQLDRMEKIEVRALPLASTIRIPPPSKTGKSVLSLKEASFGYDGRAVLKKISMEILRGDHVAVVGLNGAGKSTLLKGLSGALPPLEGESARGAGVELAFFAQHVIEALNPRHTVLQALEEAAHRELLPQQLLDLAGSLLFSGDDVRKTVSMLSGGEKSRVALGRVLLRKAPCLVLDEPTNHLDFATVEALTAALRAYEGTVIVVSHDRSFVQRVGTKILEVRDGSVRLYGGSYDEYVWSLQQSLQAPEPAAVPAAAQAPSEPKPGNWKDRKKQLDRDLRAVEKKLKECEKELGELQAENSRLNGEIAAAASPDLAQVQAMSTNAGRILELEDRWLELEAQREGLARSAAEMVEK